jgi:DNA-binding Xre family transcriptional regulator
MRLRVPELLKEHGMTAYQLAQKLEGRMSPAAVYRLASGHVVHVPLEVLDALCDVFEIKAKDLGVLLTRDKPSRK